MRTGEASQAPGDSQKHSRPRSLRRQCLGFPDPGSGGRTGFAKRLLESSKDVSDISSQRIFGHIPKAK